MLTDSLPLDLSEINQDYLLSNQEWLGKYREAYPKMRQAHPVYGKEGWWADCLTPHRFIPRLVWWMIKHHRLCLPADEASTILDLGTYDGTLVKALRTLGYNAYGTDAHDWPEMWNLLEVGQWMKPMPRTWVPGVVVSFNYAHRWAPGEFIDGLCSRFGEMPRLVLADRETRTPHPNNKFWYDEACMEAAEFSVVTFPAIACLGVDTHRDLLVRER